MEPELKKIEKRNIKCKSCDFTSQVFGEMYFDKGCQNYMATFQCFKCKILFESIITKRVWQKSGKTDNKLLSHELIYDLAEKEDIICLNCGSSENKVWNKDTGRCPKCDAEISYSFNGYINL